MWTLVAAGSSVAGDVELPWAMSQLQAHDAFGGARCPVVMKLGPPGTI